MLTRSALKSLSKPRCLSRALGVQVFSLFGEALTGSDFLITIYLTHHSSCLTCLNLYVASELAVLSFVRNPLVDQLSNLERLIRVIFNFFYYKDWCWMWNDLFSFKN